MKFINGGTASDLRHVAIALAFVACPLAPLTHGQATLATVTGSQQAEQFGQVVGFVGDVDGDGFSDVLIGSNFVGYSLGRTILFRSRVRELYTLPNTSYLLCVIGDLDNDGIREFVTSGPAGSEIRSLTVPGTITTLPIGYYLSPAGDFNLDGIEDLLGHDGGIGVAGISGATGQVLFNVYGNNYNDMFGRALSSIGDVNADGRDDFIASAPYATPGYVRVYSGDGQTLLHSWSNVTAQEVAGVGDVTGDGVPDFAISASQLGGVSVHSGSTFNQVLTIPYYGNNLRVCTGGDADGDGYGDIVVADPGASVGSVVNSGFVRVYSGSTGNLLSVRLGAAGENLGYSIDGGADFNRDGFPDVVAGAEKFVLGTLQDVGRVVVLSGSPTPPLNFCSSKVNSAGCAPFCWATGSSSISGPDDLVVHAARVLNNKLGIMFWGRQPNSVPFAGGTLCISMPFVRTDGQNSGGSSAGLDCTGVFSFPFTQTYMQQNGLALGSTVYCQFWYRDPGFPVPANVGLTDGVYFTRSF